MPETTLSPIKETSMLKPPSKFSNEDAITIE